MKRMAGMDQEGVYQEGLDQDSPVRRWAEMFRENARSAEARLRQELQAAGGPLVEPVDGDPLHMWVTFVYFGPAARVSLHSSLAMAAGVPTLPLVRLAGDVWAVALKVRHDVATTYQFVVDDPLAGLSLDDLFRLTVRDPARAAALMAQLNASAVADPCNPHRMPPQNAWSAGRDPAAEPEERWDSVLTMPAAQPLDWPGPPAAERGRLEQHTFTSTRLGNQRVAAVYTPPGYRPDAGPYPLLVCLDAELMVTWDFAEPMDRLIAAGRIPPLVAVYVGNIDPGMRMVELAANAGFVAMLADELLPWIRQRLAVTTDPSQTLIAGASLGGLTAVYAALERPDIFGGALSMSGSFWIGDPAGPSGPLVPGPYDEPEWPVRWAAQLPRRPVRIWLDAGILENTPVGPIQGTTLLASNRHLRNVLQARGYEVGYYEAPGGHDPASWIRTFPRGLAWLLGRS